MSYDCTKYPVKLARQLQGYSNTERREAKNKINQELKRPAA
jgi:hypothetical protein